MRRQPGRKCLTLAFAVLLATSPLSPTFAGTQPVRTRSVGQHRTVRAARTAVTVVIRRCPECTVQAVHNVPLEGPAWWSHPQTVGPDGHVRLDVPTRRTEGMTFFVDAPWHGNTGVASLMVARYDDLATGSAVDRTTARSAKQGSPCWAGATGSKARLVLRVERFRTTTLTGGHSFHPRAYSTHTLPSWPPAEPTFKGSVGAQNAYPCARPAAAPRAPAARKPRTTMLTFTAARCEGCRVRLARWSDIYTPPWISAERIVHDGRVRFDVSTARTHGLEIEVTGPWEDVTGYQTFVVAQYAGRRPGSHIGFAAARRQQQGSVCWAGTNARRATLGIAVRKVSVRNNITGKQVAGTIAWLPTQARTWPSMRGVSAGVYGSEELTVCQPG